MENRYIRECIDIAESGDTYKNTDLKFGVANLKRANLLFNRSALSDVHAGLAPANVSYARHKSILELTKEEMASNMGGCPLWIAHLGPIMAPSACQKLLPIIECEGNFYVALQSTMTYIDINACECKSETDYRSWSQAVASSNEVYCFGDLDKILICAHSPQGAMATCRLYCDWEKSSWISDFSITEGVLIMELTREIDTPSEESPERYQYFIYYKMPDSSGRALRTYGLSLGCEGMVDLSFSDIEDPSEIYFNLQVCGLMAHLRLTLTEESEEPPTVAGLRVDGSFPSLLLGSVATFIEDSREIEDESFLFDLVLHD